MTRPLLLAAAASLVLAACATQAQPVRTVYLSGPGEHHYVHRHNGRDRVVVIRRGDRVGRDIAAYARSDAHRQAAEARRHAAEAARMARLNRPDPDEIARITREAQALGEEARRLGEVARQRGEEARRAGEAARLRGEAVRRDAERLRQQCERGEIQCTIIENGVVIYNR